MKYNELLECASKLGFSNKLITIWIPEDKYVDAHFSEDSLSITRESDPYYGMAFGPTPLIDPRWTHFSCARSTPKEITAHVPLSGQWDAYGIETKSFEVKYKVLNDFTEIDSFIEAHAPQSSIRADDKELISA